MNPSYFLLSGQRNLGCTVCHPSNSCLRTTFRGGPQNPPYVSCSLQSQVLQWVQLSQLSCHSGIRWMLLQFKCHIWGPSMVYNTKSVVSACTIYSRNRSSHAVPAAVLNPLPVPHWPWSHNAMDFVTGLPPPEGNSIILSIVDRSSKEAHFVALPKLPPALGRAMNLRTVPGSFALTSWMMTWSKMWYVWF